MKNREFSPVLDVKYSAYLFEKVLQRYNTLLKPKELTLQAAIANSCTKDLKDLKDLRELKDQVFEVF